MKTMIGSLALAITVVACGGATDAVGGGSPTPDADGGSNAANAANASNGSSGPAASSGSTRASDASSGGDAICALPKVVGNCKAALPRYWFNASTGKCELFSYGGCGANANNFDSITACVAACANGSGNACDHVTCSEGEKCVFLDAKPTCATPCESTASGGAACPDPTAKCRCGSSCPNCKNCLQVCSAS